MHFLKFETNSILVINFNSIYATTINEPTPAAYIIRGYVLYESNGTAKEIDLIN